MTLVGRDALVKAVRARGLLVVEGDRRAVVSELRAVTAIDDIPPKDDAPDLILITVKAHDTEETAIAVAPLARQGIPVLLLQNGVGGDEIAREALTGCVVLSAVITLAVAVPEPGHVEVTTARGGVGLAGDEVDRDLVPYATLLQEAGFTVRTYSDYRAMKWSKLLLNIIANATPAILDLAPEEVYADRALARLELTAFREAVAVMRGLGLPPVALPGYPVPLMVTVLTGFPTVVLGPLFRRLVGGGRGGKMPSLHMDLARGRHESEVEYLNGAVVRAAHRLGVRVPANEALYSVLSGIVRGEIPWAEYRGQPQALLSQVSSQES